MILNTKEKVKKIKIKRDGNIFKTNIDFENKKEKVEENMGVLSKQISITPPNLQIYVYICKSMCPPPPPKKRRRSIACAGSPAQQSRKLITSPTLLLIN